MSEPLDILIDYVEKDFRNRKIILFKALNLYDPDKSHDIYTYDDIFYKEQVCGFYYYINNVIYYYHNNVGRDLTFKQFLIVNNIEIDDDRIIKTLLEYI